MIMEFLTDLHNNGTWEQVISFWSINLVAISIFTVGAIDGEEDKTEICDIMCSILTFSFIAACITYESSWQFLSFYWNLVT